MRSALYRSIHVGGRHKRQFGRAVCPHMHSIHLGVPAGRLPRLAVELGSRVDDEAYGWAWKPYGWFGPAPRPRDILHTYVYGRRPRLVHSRDPVRG